MVRLIVQREVVNLLTGSRKGILDRYLRPKNLQEFVPDKFKDKSLDQATYVVEMNGRRAFGYNGEDIVDICRMYLEARKKGKLLPTQYKLADRAEIIVTSLAKLGITALIDEATGYQQVRARDALQAYLNRIIKKELGLRGSPTSSTSRCTDSESGIGLAGLHAARKSLPNTRRTSCTRGSDRAS
jgi:hypothetical protein